MGAKKRAAKRRSKRPGTARRARAKTKPVGPQTAFVKGLIARGEAAAPDASGKLPAGATHAIVDAPEGKTVRRARFKLK
jgi:hypothetical protein